MKIGKVIKHTLIITAGVFVILGIPFMTTDYFKNLVSGDGVDSLASATVILDQPSGSYVVLVNKKYHSFSENVDKWISFFKGGEFTYIFEDISCSVAKADSGALEMARSFQSRLPENQMKLMTEDNTLLLSRADSGAFDIIIMSKEFVDANKGETSFSDDIEVIEIKQEEGENT